MRIVIIGSGNVAYHLAAAFHQAKTPIHQIFGRNAADLEEISENFGVSCSTVSLAPADLYLIAVKDDAITETSALIIEQNCLVAHTSGSLPLETLQGDFRKAVFYPLQTFTKSRQLEYSKIPFFIETETEDDFLQLQILANSISSNVIRAGSEVRKYVHLAAVFSCNFVNHLYARAEEITSSQNIPFEFLLPLIQETAAKIEHISPREAQTGPALRSDRRVLDIHETLLTEPEKAKIYHTMNESIKKMYEL